MSDEQLAEIRERHSELDNGCESDGFVWPCDTTVVLAEVDRLTRGIVGAHYHLAEQLHEADTSGLLHYLDGLLGNLSPDDAAERAREQARAVLAAAAAADGEEARYDA